MKNKKKKPRYNVVFVSRLAFFTAVLAKEMFAKLTLLRAINNPSLNGIVDCVNDSRDKQKQCSEARSITNLSHRRVDTRKIRQKHHVNCQNHRYKGIREDCHEESG